VLPNDLFNGFSPDGVEFVVLQLDEQPIPLHGIWDVLKKTFNTLGDDFGATSGMRHHRVPTIFSFSRSGALMALRSRPSGSTSISPRAAIA